MADLYKCIYRGEEKKYAREKKITSSILGSKYLFLTKRAFSLQRTMKRPDVLEPSRVMSFLYPKITVS